MVGWHCRFNGREFEPTLGDSERQGSLACCTPWGRKESDTTQQLSNNYLKSNPHSTNPRAPPLSLGYIIKYQTPRELAPLCWPTQPAERHNSVVSWPSIYLHSLNKAIFQRGKFTTAFEKSFTQLSPCVNHGIMQNQPCLQSSI